MYKVFVIQTDNRPSLDYLLKTQEVNKKFCDILGYGYKFIYFDNNKYGSIHPATKKIHIVNDFLESNEFDVLVFLDSDAWIQNGYWLKNIINNLMNDQKKHGCFSRDIYSSRSTYINSGSFILKNNEFTKQMYKNIIHELYKNVSYHHKWQFDQYYISNYVYENREYFYIFALEIMNTPKGKVLRHNWFKNKKMYQDLSELLDNITKDKYFGNTSFNQNDHYDKEGFPNKGCHEYWLNLYR